MKTARFWVPHGESYVRLTLRNGESRHHYEWHRTDEGFSSELNVWTFEDGLVRHQNSLDGRDCDGRLTQFYETACPVDHLARLPAYGDTTIKVPDWQLEKRGQRDYSAEAMGY